MIWYDLSDGTESLDKANYKYYGSFSNIADFLSSPKMNPAEQTSLKNAVKCMDKNADDVILVDPTTAGSSSLFGLGIDPAEVEGIRGLYSGLLRYANNEIQKPNGNGITSMVNAKDQFRKGVVKTKQSIVDFFNKEPKTQQEQDKIVKIHIVDWLITEWNRTSGTRFTWTDIKNGDAIEVFVNVYAAFLKTVDVTQPPSKNSMIDLLQLLYIRPHGSTLIWTKEEKLLKKIKESYPESEWKDIIYQENLKTL
jgi:hypothetical protein